MSVSVPPPSPSAMHIRRTSRATHSRTPSNSLLPSQSLPSISFSGNWLLDEKASDSIEPLFAYHSSSSSSTTQSFSSAVPSKVTASTFDTNSSHEEHSSNLPRSRSSSSTAPAVAALIIQHVPLRRFTTYLHGLIPRYDQTTGELLRYEPLTTHKLVPREEWLLDGEYHSIPISNGNETNSELTPSTHQVRAYTAPHGNGVVVDTPCASKYDLERIERSLTKDGKQMIEEIRVLTCAPTDNTGQQTLSAPNTTPNKKPPPSPSSSTASSTPATPQVREILRLRRVWTKIQDANPNKVEEPTTPLSTSESTNGSLTVTVNSTSFVTSATSSTSTSPSPSSRLQVDSSFSSPSPNSAISPSSRMKSSAANITPSKHHPSPSTLAPNSSHITSTPNVAYVPPSFGSINSLVLHTANSFPSGSHAVTPSSIRALHHAPSSSSSSSISSKKLNFVSRIRETLWTPTSTKFHKYDMSRFLHGKRISSTSNQREVEIRELIDREHKIQIESQGYMRWIDIMLIGFLLFTYLRFIFDEEYFELNSDSNQQTSQQLIRMATFQTIRFGQFITLMGTIHIFYNIFLGSPPSTTGTSLTKES